MKQKTFNCKINEGDNPGSQTLVLEGDLGMRNSSAIGTFLNAATFNCEKVTVHLKNVEKLDVTTIQYVKALEQQLLRNQLQVGIVAELPEELKRLLANSGFSTLF
jgi:ABC-type transporter Mla MlaB component